MSAPRIPRQTPPSPTEVAIGIVVAVMLVAVVAGLLMLGVAVGRAVIGGAP